MLEQNTVGGKASGHAFFYLKTFCKARNHSLSEKLEGRVSVALGESVTPGAAPETQVRG